MRVSAALSTLFVFLSVTFVITFILLGDNAKPADNELRVMAHNRHQFVDAAGLEDGNTSAIVKSTEYRDLGPVKLSAEGHRMRIKPVYQIDELKSASPERAQYLEEVIIPLSIEALTRTFSLKYPSASPMLLERKCKRSLSWSSGQKECNQVFSETDQQCGEGRIPSYMFGEQEVCSGRTPGDCRTISAGSGSPDTDFVLVVTANARGDKCSTEDSGDMSAQGGFCVLDDGNGRPLAGFINFCPSSVTTDVSDLGKQVDLAVHEMLHGLVFEPSLFSRFRDDQGNPIRYDPIKTGTNPSNGREIRTVVTPKVRDFVRDHFGCEDLEGAELENEGGDGTIWSHWEESLFYDEIMTGLASGSGRSVLSNLTLALMEDSGWYSPDYEFAGYLGFGQNGGCDFARNKCHGGKASSSPYYCSNTGEVACTFNELSLGRCEVNPLADGCGIVKGYGNYLCQDSQNNDKGSPLQLFDSSSLCVKGDDEPWKVQSRERRGFSVMTTTSTYPSAANGCFEFQCNQETDVFVNLGQAGLVRCPQGSYLDLTRYNLGFSAGKFGPCPGPEVCQEQLSCAGRCNAMRGYCAQDQCHCHLGFYGHYCEQALTPQLT